MSKFSAYGRMALVPTVALVCMVALPGCGSKVTQENYGQIKPGMTEAEVTNVLGSPTSTDKQDSVMGAAAKKVWKDGDKTISVIFLEGKVFAMEKSGF